MAWVIHFKDYAMGREMRWRVIDDRDATLSRGCSLVHKQMREVHKIVGPGGQEISRAEIESYCKSNWRA
jgi:hypothetical protein